MGLCNVSLTSCLQELISSPLGSKHSQTDSQSESSQNNDQDECGQSFSSPTCTPCAHITSVNNE